MIRAAAFGAACLLALAGAAPASAEDKPVNLRISIWVPAAHPLVPATKVWADDITKSSGGSITASIFPAEQLGKAFDHYDMARDGIADITYVNPGYQPGRFPIISAGQIPFVFGDGHKGTQAFDAWYRQYAAKEMKDTKVLLRLHPRSRQHSQPQEDCHAGRSQGHEGAPGAKHNRTTRDDARRHQRAGVSAGIA